MWAPPRKFDEYVVHRLLGKGQMGQVHLGHDTLLDRDVAIKFISAPIPSGKERQRFLIEARAVARIQHPNVVSVYRVGEIDERAFLISELVRGKSLDQLEKPMPWGDALKIAIDLVRGLAAAHKKGVLHRDLKPANAILTEDGEAKLLDFGLAKLSSDRAPAVDRVAAPPADDAAYAETGDVPSRAATDGSEQRATAALTIAPDDDADRAAATETIAPDLEARGLTRAGALLGTPDYMSPETWRGEPATRASDLYSLGALIYELASGRAPYADVAPQQLALTVQTRAPLPLARIVPAIDPRFAELVDRCLRRDPADRFSSADELRDALESIWRKNRGASIPEGNPYRGLRPFEASHRALFFGRDTDLNTILERLRAEGFVLVSGDSGIGKSSICRAGVLPALIDEGLEGRSWSYLTVTPGRHPARALATALAPLISLREEETYQLMAEDLGGLVSRVRKRLASKNGLLIFVDQFEELVTQSDPTEVAVVEQLLLRIAAGLPGVRLLATARADFLTRLVALTSLGEEVSRSIHILRPLSGSRIRQVIVGPAEITGVRFESEELVEMLASSMDGAPGGLPLLQFALAELWEARERPAELITRHALEQIGGVSGALARHADEVIDRLRPKERELARRVLVRLVSKEGVRAKRTEHELIGDDRTLVSLLDALVRGRLLVVEEMPNGSAFALAHDILITGWARLVGWIQEDAGAKETRERVVHAAAEWARLGRGAEALWSRRQLNEVAQLEHADLDREAQLFLDGSKKQVAKRARLRAALMVAVPLVVGISYGGARLKADLESSHRIGAQLDKAHLHLAAAQAEEARAQQLRDAALAEFDRERREAAEPIWAEALENGRRASQSYVGAVRALDTALELDREDPIVEQELGDALFSRALLLERERRWDVLGEVVDRLHLHDRTGRLAERWKRPGTVELRRLPAGANLTVERYQTVDARLVATPIPAASATARLELEPGSYRLTVEAPDRPRVRVPLVVDRGGSKEIDLSLPSASRVPPGFVMVPRGAFIFGSTADEESRVGFFDAVPAHEIDAGAFLIAQHEVTFEEWIRFLDTLPAAERRVRTPGLADDGSLTGTVLLEERAPREWELSMRPGNQLYRARAGEPIRYAARDRRATQNWLRFPVTGISAEDAEAYASWLKASGHLSGARLCTEAEWEKAARGADGREFPHGDRLAKDEANFDQTYGKNPGGIGPDEVGSHPGSRSPFDVDDMAGNAFEWTVAAPGSPTYVLKGGSYFYDSKTNRLSNRAVSVGTLRAASVGARLCATLPDEVASAR